MDSITPFKYFATDGRAYSGLLPQLRQLCLAAVFAGSTLGALAQSGTASLSGRVSNARTGAYLGNAEVRISGTDIMTATQANGGYTLNNVPAGDVQVVVTYTGLDTKAESVKLPPDGSATLDFDLTSKQYGEVVKLEKFVVASMREGAAKAIVEQRQALNIKSVIASDAFGSVTEDNIGEFLKYMPGLSINYNENDARTVSVRGMPSKYSSVTIDGNSAASADFNMATGREFQFEQVSLSTISTVEVNKSPLADQPANSLAGSVNVKSKSAFDQKGRRITYSASLTANSYAMELRKTKGWDNEEHYKTLPGGALSFSDTLLDGRLGVVASLSHSETYVDQKIIAGLGRQFDADPNNNEAEIPRINQVNWQDGPKPTYRSAALVNLDYKLSKQVLLSLRTSYNYYNAPFHNRNWTFNANTATLSNLTASSVITTAASAADTANSITIAGTNYRKYGATFLTNPAFNWRVSPNVMIDGGLAYSRSYQWYDSDAEGFFNVVNARMNGVSWGYTSSSGKPDLQVRQFANATSNTTSMFDVANYNSNTTAQIANRDAKDQIWNAKVDVTVNLPKAGLPTLLKFGTSANLLVKDIDTWTKVWTMNVSPSAGGLDLGQYKDPLTDLSFHKGESFTNLSGVLGTAPSLDKWRLYELFAKGNTDPYFTASNTATPFYLTSAQAAANLRNRLQNMFDFKETLQAAYGMATVKVGKKVSAVAGLRFESTESQGRAYDDLGNALTVAKVGTTNTNDFNYIIARYGSRTLKRQSYDNLFPSFQVRYSPRNNLILRGSYFRSILRPDPANIARALSINDTQTAVTDTNPDLKPEFADNFDVRLEYYFEPVGLFSVGVFHKKIKEGQLSLTSTLTADNMPQDVLDLGGTVASTLVTNGATFTRVVNGPANSISGFELDYSQQLSFLPGALKGFGVFANYTYTKPEDLITFALSTGGSAASSGIPKHNMNGGLNYKHRQFSGSIKANWMGERLLGVSGYSINTATLQPVLGTGTNNNIMNYENPRLIIDVNLEYKVSRWATVFMNGGDIGESRSIRYNVRREFLNRDGGYGAKYTLGVKGTF